jgi:hypothetical protein
MRVALIGPPQSGKSTLFAAVAEAGGSNVDLSRPDQPHLAVVKVPDERLDWLVNFAKPEKLTHAELEFLDLPGFDLADQAAREHSKTHWPAMRNADMLVVVAREFASDSVPAYRNRVDPSADVEEFLGEMIFADLDQAASRLSRLEASLKKPTGDRHEQQQELDLMKRIVEALESERPVSSAIRNEAEGKLLRSFAFLSRKPILSVLNCSEDDVSRPAEATAGTDCMRLSAKIEEEIAQLAPADRKEFLADLDLPSSARDRLVRACYERMDLVSFLTQGPKEVRAWTIPAGTDAVTAAGTIHSDIARGFIRAETIAFEDLKQAGDVKAAKAAGKVRLEGKGYVVRDGDIMNFRFNV